MKQEKYVVGTINLDSDESLEEALINSKNALHIKKLGDLKVEVYSGEGQIPHMHIYGDNFNTCVCLYDNMYFAHAGKYRDKFNNSQLKQFSKWLDQQISTTTSAVVTNWEIACIMWDNFNPECKFPNNKKTNKKPNYEYMTNFKEQ